MNMKVIFTFSDAIPISVLVNFLFNQDVKVACMWNIVSVVFPVEVFPCQLLVRASVRASAGWNGENCSCSALCRYRSWLTVKSSDCVIKVSLALTPLTSSRSSNTPPQLLWAVRCDSSMLFISPPLLPYLSPLSDLADFTLTDDVLDQSISRSPYQGPSLQSVSWSPALWFTARMVKSLRGGWDSEPQTDQTKKARQGWQLQAAV